MNRQGRNERLPVGIKVPGKRLSSGQAMNVKRWFKARFQNGSTRSWEHDLTDAQPRGDFRGPYGFGRRAHRPDPKASYSFGDDPTHRMHHPVPGQNGH